MTYRNNRIIILFECENRFKFLMLFINLKIDTRFINVIATVRAETAQAPHETLNSDGLRGSKRFHYPTRSVQAQTDQVPNVNLNSDGLRGPCLFHYLVETPCDIWRAHVIRAETYAHRFLQTVQDGPTISLPWLRRFDQLLGRK